MKLNYLIFFLLIQFLSINAQRKYENQVRDMGIESLNRFKFFLSLANDAANGNEIEENINWVNKELKSEILKLNLYKHPLYH